MGKKGGDDGGAAQARADEQARQDKIRSGTASINTIFDGGNGAPGQFGDDFFKKISDNYMNYAQPQLDKQYGDAQKQLTYSLSRSGNLDSSTRGAQEGELKNLYDTNERSIKDTALNTTNDARNNVENARSDLIRTLNATGDAEGASNSALERARALSTPQGFSPIGQLFSTFTSGLGTQAALERANAYSGGLIKPTYNTGLFGNPSAVKVT